jgi:hypothetical protein
VPISPDISKMSDSGTPFVLTLPDGVETVDIYTELAKSVEEEVQLLNKPKTEVTYSPEQGHILVSLPPQDGKPGREKKISPFDLRTSCRCAGCYDEMTGVKIMQPSKVPEDVFPRLI